MANKVLVTGGAGFIGSHLCDALIEKGNEVFIIDNMSTGKKDNIIQLDGKASLIRGDIMDIDKLGVPDVDAVLHIAGNASVVKSFDSMSADLMTNTIGTIKVLEWMIKRKVPRILYASSMTVYEDLAIPLKESTSQTKPSNYYGISKLAAERYVMNTAKRSDLGFKMEATSFRMFNVYGPRQDLSNPYQGVLAIFLGKLLNGEPIKIFGDGEQSRSFVFIDDVVKVWMNALNQQNTFGKVINIGTKHPISMNQLVNILQKATGFKAQIENLPPREGDMKHCRCDCEFLNSLMSGITYSFKTIDEGTRKTAEWAKNEWKKENYI